MNAGNIRDVYGGASYTLVAESYWNLGLAGIALLCVGFGYVLQVVECEGSRNVNYMRAIVYKTFAGAVVSFIEVPQLGVNGIVLTLFLNLAILAFLSAEIHLA